MVTGVCIAICCVQSKQRRVTLVNARVSSTKPKNKKKLPLYRIKEI